MLVLGAVGMTGDVIIFSASRALARIGQAGISIVNFAALPEYASQYGRKNYGLFKKMAEFHIIIALICILLYVLCSIYLARPIFEIYTSHLIDFRPHLVYFLIATVGAEMLWSAGFTPVSAVNYHAKTSYIFSLVCIVSLILSIPMIIYFGLNGAALSVLSAHLLMDVIVAFSLVKLLSRLESFTRPANH